MKRRTFLAALTLPALAAIAPKAFAKKELKTEKYKGTVKFYNQAKGFGFIKADIDDEDIFVHSSGLVDQIRENDKVSYYLERGKKGKMAVIVERVR